MKLFSWILSFIKKNMIYIFPLLLLLAYRYSPTKFVNYSNSVLGKLLAICAIFMYLNMNYLYGVLACLLVILYYQSDFFENMTTLELNPSVEKQKGSCGCSKKHATQTNKTYKNNDIESRVNANANISTSSRITNLSKLSIDGPKQVEIVEGFQQYGLFEKIGENVNENGSDSSFCALCKNTNDGDCSMCNMIKDIFPVEDRFSDEEYLRTQRISGREIVSE